MFWFFTIIFIVIIILMMSSKTYKEISKADSINRKNLNEMVKNLNVRGERFRSHNNSCEVLMDKEKRKLHVIYSEEQTATNIHKYKHVSCDFDDIIESEVIIDNHTITKTARGSQIGGAVVGGVLLGGIGAIIGGLSGTKGSFDQVKHMDIKLTVNNLETPIIKINFLDGQDRKHNKLKQGYHKNSLDYQNAVKEIEKWQGMFEVILHNKE